MFKVRHRDGGDDGRGRGTRVVEWEEEGKGEGGDNAGLVDKNYEWNEKREDLLTTGKEVPGVGLADLSAQ